MACSGCDARREWIKRKAKLAAQALSALVRQQPQLAQRTEEALAIRAKDIAALPMTITTNNTHDHGHK